MNNINYSIHTDRDGLSQSYCNRRSYKLILFVLAAASFNRLHRYSLDVSCWLTNRCTLRLPANVSYWWSAFKHIQCNASIIDVVVSEKATATFRRLNLILNVKALGELIHFLLSPSVYYPPRRFPVGLFPPGYHLNAKILLTLLLTA